MALFLNFVPALYTLHFLSVHLDVSVLQTHQPPVVHLSLSFHSLSDALSSPMFLGIQTPSDLGAGLSGQKQEEEADGYQWRKLTAIRV